MPAELTAPLRALWRRSYNHDPDRRIEGGDVLEPPLFPHPDSLLGDRSFTTANAVLDEFLRDHGERLVHVPLKRAFLQRDLWPIFDLLQREVFWDDGTPVEGDRGRNPNKRYTESEKERKAILSRKIAAVMRAVAPTKEEVASLPNTYDLAVRTGRSAPEHGVGRERPYLPAQLMDGSGDWVEVNTYGEGEPFHGLLFHTGVLGFEGRAWFRAFYRFPADAGGRRGLERFLSDPGADRRVEGDQTSGPDVPPGTEVALVRMLLTIDREGVILPTRIVEELQLRVLRYLDGGEHPDTDSGFGQDLFQYELRRAALLDGSNGGGLFRVPNESPRYFLAHFSFSTFATTFRFTPESAGNLIPLRVTCTSCHEHANLPRLDIRNQLRPFPVGYPFGKASLRTLRRARTPMPTGGEATLARRVIDWKTSRSDFRKLAAEMAAGSR